MWRFRLKDSQSYMLSVGGGYNSEDNNCFSLKEKSIRIYIYMDCYLKNVYEIITIKKTEYHLRNFYFLTVICMCGLGNY